MASKQFLSSDIKYIPQRGFSATYTESGGVEASQDFIVRNSDIRNGSQISVFQRGVTWQSVWPEVPDLYRNLSMKDFQTTDNGDGTSTLKVNFTGYQFSAEAGGGVEATVPTTSLVGQLEDRPLSDHPKWEPLSATAKTVLGYLISGQYVWDIDESKVKIIQEDGSLIENTTLSGYITGDAVTFANIIAEGDTTYRKGGWTYSYQTESETGFPSAQLSSLGKIVANPPGDPVDPGTGWTWLLTSPNQGQSGPKRFVKSLDFQLIRDNAKNQFLYGS
jgi:hypothetical protein